MTTGLGASAYLDVPAYLRAATNQETASLLGLNTTLGGVGVLPAGALALPVVASAGWATGPLWLLDGPYSEVVQVVAAPDATHLTLATPGTLFAHAVGVSASQAGTAGALAESVLRASAWIENYCQQGTAAGDRSLFALPRTERWAMPGVRAWLDRDGVLAVRPGHFPVLTVTALSVDLGQGQAVSLDVSQVELEATGRLIEASLLVGNPVAPGQQSLWAGGVSRARRQWVVVSYSGGIAPGGVPYDVAQACIWVVSDLLAVRRNPSGAAVVRQGKFELQARPRVDPTGDSLLLIRAKASLESYRTHAL